ncbi:MAG: flagellar biosynthesis protein FlhF [Anaeromicrobium sp.]|jgi:flagellar biosynthesis protein FlhF|uniref:flagellar biosynthesis protein FlhF n=1 Tax=Anaeromicrobium sp. TaxID=1929132 RepID=UPI0025F0D6D9|nr:flagellar biosynthesis protein FlhF [Anaeromicrobium sp.]MCT4595599.1 flagellar biosynthesis protein FlhF [Anaeromicrobium sp.]
MKVKRYIGKTSYEAMMKVKAELGSDALILHSRKIKKSGFFGIFKKPLHEVVAAVDEGKSDHKNIKYDKFVVNNLKDKSNGNLGELKDKIENIENILSNFVKEGKSQGNEEDISNNMYMEYYNKLINSGLSKGSVDTMMNIVNKRLTFTKGNEEFINKGIENVIKEILGQVKEDMEIEKQKIIVFMGPTGVGKTTTLAKLAAKYIINEKKKVGFITADTYRIAAVEQLKVYAEILNVPVSVVYEPQEINEAISNYEDKDVILIDTAGRNHNNSEQLEEVKKIIELLEEPEIYLVLSNTSSYDNMIHIIEAYKFVEDYKIIITKIDEGRNYANILNAKLYAKKNLSYITNGQSVPDDIEIANAQKIAENIVGGFNE